jgi:hypothetical protein
LPQAPVEAVAHRVAGCLVRRTGLYKQLADCPEKHSAYCQLDYSQHPSVSSGEVFAGFASHELMEEVAIFHAAGSVLPT